MLQDVSPAINPHVAKTLILNLFFGRVQVAFRRRTSTPHAPPEAARSNKVVQEIPKAELKLGIPGGGWYGPVTALCGPECSALLEGLVARWERCFELG